MKTKYACLEQRMVNTYLDTFPSFVPSESGPGIRAQDQFYRFMHGLYRRLSEEPTLMFSSLNEDDAYTRRFNKGADNKPKLKNWMRSAIKKVDALLLILFQVGQSGQVDGNALVVNVPVKISKRHRLLLEQLRLHQRTASEYTVWSHDDYSELFQAWIWMATRPGASLYDFSRCLFREGYSYATDVYARLSGDESAFRRLERYLVENGYTRMDNWKGTLTLDYYKTHGDKPPVKGGFNYGIRHTGISASYDLLMDSPPIFGLCIPRMKEVLTTFDNIPAGVQSFIAARTKKCDGCRYCVQTDKTGKRPLANLPVSYNGRELRLCPYFPGYRYCWTALSDGLVDNMIAMLGFMDMFFKDA